MSVESGAEPARTGFRVIEGGRRPGVAPTVSLQPPKAPNMGPEELAAEMAELYALALVRDLPFEMIADPHSVIWVDGNTRFTLHELLCELRSLSWFNDQALPVPGPIEAAFRSRAACGEADHRRGLRRNGDGQLTLRTLFRGVVAGHGAHGRLSAFHQTDRKLGRDPEPCQPPETGAPMSQWLDWVERCSGASLALPGRDESGPAMTTPRALATRLGEGQPCRIYFNAVLMLLARGAAFDPGLQAETACSTVSAQHILSLMAATSERAFAMAMSQQGRAERLSRPGVTAARLTAMLSHEEFPGTARGGLREVAEELSNKVPNLLHWIDRLNRATGRGGRFSQMLLLPALPTEAPAHRSDCAANAMVAGALSTLVKALFDSRRHARLRMVGGTAGGVDIGAEADRLAADIALARSVSGGYFQAENYQDLRLGEALACQMLRAHLESRQRCMSLSFVDFDGTPVSISVHPQGQARGQATFHRDGRPAPWPMEQTRSGSHLAVV